MTIRSVYLAVYVTAVALLFTFGAWGIAHAQNGNADCTPFDKKCEKCGEKWNEESKKCEKKGEKSNMRNCACYEVKSKTQGICTAENFCHGQMCNGKPCEQTKPQGGAPGGQQEKKPEEKKDEGKGGEPPGLPPPPGGGDGGGGQPPKPEDKKQGKDSAAKDGTEAGAASSEADAEKEGSGDASDADAASESAQDDNAFSSLFDRFRDMLGNFQSLWSGWEDTGMFSPYESQNQSSGSMFGQSESIFSDVAGGSDTTFGSGSGYSSAQDDATLYGRLKCFLFGC